MERSLNPRLVGIGGALEGGVFALTDDEISIGREHTNRLPIDDGSVSRRHCTIHRLAPDRFEIRDLGSRNGTAVNGLPIIEGLLRDGDQIRLGQCHFLFLLSESNERSNSTSVRFEQEGRPTRSFQQLRPHDNQLRLEPLLDGSGAHPVVSGSLAVLLKIAAGIHMARGTEQIARRLLERVFEAIPADHGAVLLFEGAAVEPFFACSLNRDGTPNPVARASSEIVDDVRRNGIAIAAIGALAAQQRVLAAPIVSQDRILGVIYLEAQDPAAVFQDEHLQLAAAVGGILGMPFENARRLEWLEAENRRLHDAIDMTHDMVGAGPRMREIFQLVAKAAPTGSTILIRGESGTGKELVARAIHRNSPRAGHAFVAINCAALTETLLESELFGHEKGAFTGAIAQKKGKLEMADGGSLFLDEVGELPPAFQTKLLRVLQEREFERVGGARSIRVDVRLIAATNRDLESAIAGNTFRQDLYYRLNVVSLTMPALRDRREDIPLLARHFAAKHSQRAARRIAGLSPEALACLNAYDWPGNVRELENAIERAVVLGTTDLIRPEDLPETVLDAASAPSDPPGGFYATVRDGKKRAILAALEQAEGSYTEAAKLLGLHPNYLHRLVRTFDLKAEVKKKRRD
jgi:Nif-specific regulatory protein